MHWVVRVFLNMFTTLFIDMVNFTKVGPASLDFFIDPFTQIVDLHTYNNVKQDVLL